MDLEGMMETVLVGQRHSQPEGMYVVSSDAPPKKVELWGPGSRRGNSVSVGWPSDVARDRHRGFPIHGRR